MMYGWRERGKMNGLREGGKEDDGLREDDGWRKGELWMDG